MGYRRSGIPGYDELFFYDFGFGSVFLYAFDAVFAVGFGGIAFGDSDDLTVAGLQAETVFTGLVLIQFKLGMGDGFEVLDSLIFHIGNGGILFDTLNAVEAGCLGLIDLGSGDDLTIGGLQIEFDAGGDGADYKFTHNVLPFSA